MPARTMNDCWKVMVGGAAALALCASACGAGDDPAAGTAPEGAEGEGDSPSGAEGQSSSPGAPITIDQFEGVSGYDRAPGMPIGAGAEDEATAAAGDPGAEPEALPESTGNEDIAIPTFDVEEDTAPPCSECIELSVHLDSPNQQADFSFDAGGVAVTRVVWNLIISKNEDQLFIRTSVNGQDGPYRQTLANTFPVVGEAFEYVHEQGEGSVWSGNAQQVGLKIGSSGGWARNERMRVFVESVVLEGADGASKSFASGAEGVVATTTAQDPQVTHHP